MYERARAEVGNDNPLGADMWSMRAFSRSPPSFAQAHLIRGKALILTKHWQEARREFDTYMKLEAPSKQQWKAFHALSVLSQLESNPPESPPHYELQQITCRMFGRTGLPVKRAQRLDQLRFSGSSNLSNEISFNKLQPTDRSTKVVDFRAYSPPLSDM